MAGSPLNILLVTLGTAGDVHPFVGIGRVLRERGHRVTLVASGYFAELAKTHGLEFVPVGTADDFRRALHNPKLWRPWSGMRTLAGYMIEHIEPQYEAIDSLNEPGRTVIVSSGAAFAARIAHDRLGTPLVTLVLQPNILRSLDEPPVLAGVPLLFSWMPRWMKRGLYRAGDALADRMFQRSRVNAFRDRLGLPPIKRMLNEWWLSPSRVIGLFPSWFGPPQADWPAQFRQTGFPLFDERTQEDSLPPRLSSFLDAGSPPVVFTPGSGMVYGREFFQTAVDACGRIGLRAILLSRFEEHIPRPLPPGVLHLDYVPFSLVLPRSAALVHHGGVGTTAQALAAGIPQVLRPMAYDQPDNAWRTVRLGVGESIRPRRFTSSRLAEALLRLTKSRSVAESCRNLAGRIHPRDAVTETCGLIEEMGR